MLWVFGAPWSSTPVWVFLEDGAGFRNPSFAELCNFLRKRRVIQKRPNSGIVKFWQKMGHEIAVLSYPTY